MKILNSLEVDVSLETILYRLREEAFSKGYHYLKDIRVKSKSIQVTCPYHNLGQESNPSAGITNIDKETLPVGIFSCFTCGQKSNLFKLIAFVLGQGEDNAQFGRKWLLDNFGGIYHYIEPKLQKLEDFFSKPKTFVSEEELKSYRGIYHPYAEQRKITKEVAKKYDVGYDVKSQCLTFPVKDELGRVVFCFRRSVKGRYFNYPEGVEKPVYGAEFARDSRTPVIVCESVINALTCVGWGYQAVALMGTGNTKQFKQLENFQSLILVLGLDGDEAGRKATKRIQESISNKLFKVLDIPTGKDINDLTKEEFDKLYNKAFEER